MTSPELPRQIIKNGAIADDTWQHVSECKVRQFPKGDIIVSLETWKTHSSSLLDRSSSLGIRLSSDESVDDIASDLQHFRVIAIEFPVMTDGRGFSIARRLREQHGFTGEIRAVGDVLRDQLFFMYRCGFNSFEIRPDKSLEEALNAFNEISITYQSGIDEPNPLWKRSPRS